MRIGLGMFVDENQARVVEKRAIDFRTRGSLLGDKAASMVFDNSKIKRFVPGYCATVPFTLGIRRTIAWFDADPARRQVDPDADARWDKLIEAYEYATQQALSRFRG